MHSRSFRAYRLNPLLSFQFIDHKFITLFIKPNSEYFNISKDGYYFNMSEGQLNIREVTEKGLIWVIIKFKQTHVV